jgi:hypothetical protein
MNSISTILDTLSSESWDNVQEHAEINPSACRHLIPSSYYVVGRFCCRVFKF